MTWAPGYTPPRGIQVNAWSQSEITETPRGNGPPNEVNLGRPSVNGGVQIGEVNRNNELYDPANNTVYISNYYGADITAGKRPGTYVYTLPRTPNAPAGSAAAEQNAHMPPPLTITAARPTRCATARQWSMSCPISGKGPQPTSRSPPPTASPTKPRRSVPAAHRQASSSSRGQRPSMAAARSSSWPSTASTSTTLPPEPTPRSEPSLGYGATTTATTTYSEYLLHPPATAANDRLLDLTFGHPRSANSTQPHADYLAAQARLITGS